MRKAILAILVLCAIILAIAIALQLLVRLFYPDLTFTVLPILPIFVGLFIAYWFTLGSRWGGVDCPKCGTRQPTWRKPNSFRQTLLGGWTCANCGTEIDRRGKAIETKA
jgi:hypothetical protein